MPVSFEKASRRRVTTATNICPIKVTKYANFYQSLKGLQEVLR
jgi:hypothetical protein